MKYILLILLLSLVVPLILAQLCERMGKHYPKPKKEKR